MLNQFLFAFREAFEAALITSIILAYLSRTGRRLLSRYVWYGVYIAVASSLALGISIWLVYGALSPSIQTLFEGIAALLAVAVLSSMIYWMATRGKNIKEEIEKKVEAAVTQDTVMGLIFISFVVVFREGLETVLFLMPFLNDAIATLGGAFIGVLISLGLAYAIFVVGVRINIRRFFYFTSILLILVAGGLAGYGTHELIEYSNMSGWLADNAYELPIPEGNPLHHKNIVGLVPAVMFGYTVEAEWARVIVHLAYLAVALPLVIMVYRKP